jgi:hypothetical protein
MQAQAPNQEATARNRRLVDDVEEMAGHSAMEAMPDGICTRPSTAKGPRYHHFPAANSTFYLAQHHLRLFIHPSAVHVCW